MVQLSIFGPRAVVRGAVFSLFWKCTPGIIAYSTHIFTVKETMQGSGWKHGIPRVLPPALIRNPALVPNAVQVSATATNAMKGLMASDPQRAWGYFNALHAGGLADAFHFTIAIPLCNTREGLQRLVHEMHDMMKGCRAGHSGARACLRT